MPRKKSPLTRDQSRDPLTSSALILVHTVYKFTKNIFCNLQGLYPYAKERKMSWRTGCHGFDRLCVLHRSQLSMKPLIVCAPYLIIKYLIIVQTKQFFAQLFFLLFEIAFVKLCFRMTSPIWRISCKTKVRTVFVVQKYSGNQRVILNCVIMEIHIRLCMTTLTEVFPCFFLSCKANARVKPARTGHGPSSS
jgi:hypothetical protein